MALFLIWTEMIYLIRNLNIEKYFVLYVSLLSCIPIVTANTESLSYAD